MPIEYLRIHILLNNSLEQRKLRLPKNPTFPPIRNNLPNPHRQIILPNPPPTPSRQFLHQLLINRPEMRRDSFLPFADRRHVLTDIVACARLDRLADRL